MGLRLTFRLYLESDYHVGAGHRLGTEGDSALLRDGDQRPAIRGSTLRPLLRDGLRRLLSSNAMSRHGRRCVASGQEGDDPVPYCESDPCPACLIFGSPARAGQWRVSSAKPVDASRVSKEVRPDWGGQLAYHVRVSPRERRAEPAKLFSREEGDSRLQFEFTAECSQADTGALKQAALLVASARMVRELGAGRRRGRGQCHIDLIRATDSNGVDIAMSGDDSVSPTDRWLSEFERQWLQAAAATTTAGTMADTPAVPRLGSAGARQRYQVIFRTEEPILIAQRAEAANEFESISYIPGGVLLGAIAACAVSRFDVSTESPEARAVFAELFRRGRVRFPMLYPCRVEGERLVPAIPFALDLVTCSLKPGYPGEGHGVWIAGSRKDCAQCGNSKLMDMPGKFIALHPRIRVDVQQRVELHNRINPRTGRVAMRDLFAYRMLEAGHYFTGEIECDLETWETMQEMADLPALGEAAEMRLGKATGRGHGRVSFVIADAGEMPMWIGASFENRCPAAVREVSLTLLTDAILVDAWGRGYGDVWEWLRGELKMTEESLVRRAGAWKSVDGFNGVLGLPRWRDTAVKAGSTVTFHLPEGEAGAAIRTMLQMWEMDGIGLRRHEGFGRIAVNHPAFTLDGFAESPDATPIPAALLTPDAAADDTISVEQAFRNECKKLFGEVNEDDFSPDKGPFCGVARLIWAEAIHGEQAVRSRIKQLEKPESVIDSAVVKKALEARDKEKRLDNKGRKGRERIEKWLDELKSCIEDQERYRRHAARLWTMGLRMMAETIGDMACRGQTEGR
jgi:CRISPR-associated protein Csx10